MTFYLETWTISTRPVTLTRMEPLLRQAAEDEWEDDAVKAELTEIANDIRSRLQRIEKGDLQR